jgi:hypothetical protein
MVMHSCYKLLSRPVDLPLLNYVTVDKVDSEAPNMTVDGYLRFTFVLDTIDCAVSLADFTELTMRR